MILKMRSLNPLLLEYTLLWYFRTCILGLHYFLLSITKNVKDGKKKYLLIYGIVFSNKIGYLMTEELLYGFSSMHDYRFRETR